MFPQAQRTPILPTKPPEGSSKAGYRRRLHKGLKATSSQSERLPVPLCDDDLVANNMDLLFELPCEQQAVESTRASFSFDSHSSFEHGKHVNIRLKFNPSPRTPAWRLSGCEAEDKEPCTEPYEKEASETAGKGSQVVVAGAGSLLRSLGRNDGLLDSSKFVIDESMYADPLLMLFADQAHFVKDERASRAVHFKLRN